MRKTRKPRLRAVGQADNRVEQFIQECAEEEATRFSEHCDMLRRRCESPIEELVAIALYQFSRVSYETIHMYESEFPSEPDFDEAIFVYQQASIGQYRVDFAIWDASLPFNHTPPRVMIVECDGHDFHEKTKEQARRDKQRDRFLVSKGYKVLRFTGSEIWADPNAIADEIINEIASNDSWRNREK